MKFLPLWFASLQVGLVLAGPWIQFDAGHIGACGTYISDNDFVIAVDKGAWVGGKYCGRNMSLELGGTVVQGAVLDLCHDCPRYTFAVTPAIWATFQLAPEDIEVTEGSWKYVF
ncbi:hypothetical protein FA15DRAFT_670946 [Coprinopsis marcescibilis]|uniref:RlpA-like protein double-psi beta-barrel domain-containing protein n=1 Tax=Coprinopsis marcescibilis TaxID=230819 RepID=A0A5C3KRC8_COPMA|nr:hypothetical protein FA15DRAFT_670946 [Coprinopsis marcescibilis]